MMRYQTDKGVVTISSDVFTNIAGMAASNCFGREAMGKGVLVTYNEDESVTIDLHVVMDHGINIAAVCPAIINEVSYVVSKTTGVPVKTVNVYIDSISVD